MISIIFSLGFYGAIGFVFYVLLRRKAFFSLSVLGLYFLFLLFVFITTVFDQSVFWAVFATLASFLIWSWIFLIFFMPALFFDFWRSKRIRMQNIGMQDNKRKITIAVIVFIFIAIIAGFIFVKYPELFKWERELENNLNLGEPRIIIISPKQTEGTLDYSLIDYPLKQSPIYNQLNEYCSDLKEEPWTIQQDARLVKNSNEVIIPSIRQLIFASGNEEPNCVTIVKVFSVPQSGKYLYLEVSKLTFKEHFSWPIYRLDLSDLSIKKLSISAGGSIRVEEGENFMGFLSSNNTLLSDGKKLVWWDEKKVYLINLEKDSESILYTAPQNQWLISGVDPEDVIGQFFNTDVQIDKNQNQITIGVYDKIMSQDGKRIFDESGDINWLELEPKGERLIEHKFKLMDRVTISIPLDN